VKVTSKNKKQYMVITTARRHEIFLIACEYLHIDIHTALNVAMKDTAIAALRQMELEGVETADARKSLLSAWQSNTYIKMPDSVILEPSGTPAPLSLE